MKKKRFREDWKVMWDKYLRFFSFIKVGEIMRVECENFECGQGIYNVREKKEY